MSSPAPMVTLLASRGRTAVGELWSANSVDGVTLTVEVLDPGVPGASTGRWEALPRATHPALALPLPVETRRGPAVALSPLIGQAPAQTTGDPRALAALAFAYARALESLHGHGLGHNAIAPSLLCATPTGAPQLVVTAACVLPLDVTADLTALHASLARIDGRAHEQLFSDPAVATAATAAQLAAALHGYSADPTVPPAGLRAAAAPVSLTAAPVPGPRLLPVAPPNGGPAVAPGRGRSRGTLPTRPLLIAGGVAIALIAGTAIAGAVTGGSHQQPPPAPARPARTSTPTASPGAADPTTAVSTPPMTPPAVAVTPPPVAAPPATAPATIPVSTAPTPTPPHTHSPAQPSRRATHPPTPPAPTAVHTTTAPVYVPPPVAPAPRPSAEPVVTGDIPPPK